MTMKSEARERRDVDGLTRVFEGSDLPRRGAFTGLCVQASVPRHQSCDIQSAPVPPVQGALRSEWPALYQQRNTALAAQARSLRASQEAAIRGVMPLGKGWAIPCEPCLAADRFLTR